MFAIFVDVFIVIVLLIFAIFAVTQIVVPIFKGTRLFPALDRKRKANLQTLTELQTEEEIKGLETVIAQRRRDLAKRVTVDALEKLDGSEMK